MNNMLSRQQIIELFSEEKNKYSSYLQLCAYYKTDPDPILIARYNGKIEIYELLIKLY